MPRSVPPGHWYDDHLLEQNGQAGGQEYGERDPRVLRGPSEPAEGNPPRRRDRDAGRAAPSAHARPGPRDESRGTPPGYDPRHLSRGNPPGYGSSSRDADVSQAQPGYDPPGRDARAFNEPQPGYGPSRRDARDAGPRIPPGYDPAGQDTRSFRQGTQPGYGPSGYDPSGSEMQQFAQGAPPRWDGRDVGHRTPPGPGGPGGTPPGRGGRGGGPGGRGGPDETGQGSRHRHGKRGKAGKQRRHLLRRLVSHRSVQAVLVALVIFLGWVGWSVGQAMTAPGNGSVSTRLAEWARDHYLGPVVTLGEWLTYQAPKVGGKPQFSLTAPTSGWASPAEDRPRHDHAHRPGQALVAGRHTGTR